MDTPAVKRRDSQCRSPRPLRLCEPNHTVPACPGLHLHLLVLISLRREGRHGKRLSPRRAGEEPRPASAPKRSLRRGPHIHFDMLGGRNNQNQRGRPTKVCSRTTHYLRRNRRCSFGRTDTLAGKLKPAQWSGGLRHATGRPSGLLEAPPSPPT